MQDQKPSRRDFRLLLRVLEQHTEMLSIIAKHLRKRNHAMSQLDDLTTAQAAETAGISQLQATLTTLEQNNTTILNELQEAEDAETGIDLTAAISAANANAQAISAINSALGNLNTQDAAKEPTPSTATTGTTDATPSVS